MILKVFYKTIIILLFKLYYGKLKIRQKFKKKKFYINNKLFYYFYEINNCRVYTNTNDVAYIQNNKLIKGPSIQIREKGVNGDILKNVVLKIGTPKKYRYYNSRVFSLLCGIEANNSYFHWFFDSLPRLLLYKRFYNINKNDYFLVHNLKYDFQIKSLRKLGVKNFINAYDLKHIKANKIITVNFYRKHSEIPKWYISDLRKYIFKEKIINLKNKKIFIDRSNISSKIRDIHNKSKIIKYLKQKNFTVIDPSKLNFNKEIQLFYNASIVLGLYGAGLTNIIFCKKSCNVIELKGFKTDKLYENIAKKIGIKFLSIKCKKIKNNFSNRKFDGSLIVDMKKLSSTINKLVH